MTKLQVDTYLEEKGIDVIDLITDNEVQDILYSYDEEVIIKNKLDNLIQSARKYKFKTFRKDLCLTQKGFAEYFGIPIRTVQEWEQGRRKPTDYMLPLLKRLWNAENKITWKKIKKED